MVKNYYTYNDIINDIRQHEGVFIRLQDAEDLYYIRYDKLYSSVWKKPVEADNMDVLVDEVILRLTVFFRDSVKETIH